jgi:hypothetical protein
VAKQPGPSFAVLLRQLRVEAQLTHSIPRGMDENCPRGWMPAHPELDNLEIVKRSSRSDDRYKYSIQFPTRTTEKLRDEVPRSGKQLPQFQARTFSALVVDASNELTYEAVCGLNPD